MSILRVGILLRKQVFIRVALMDLKLILVKIYNLRRSKFFKIEGMLNLRVYDKMHIKLQF